MENIFKVYMSRLPDKRTERQVLVILDEASSLLIDTLETTLANCRKHHMAVALFYQHVGQCMAHMGEETGTALLSNCYSKVYLTGSDLRTSKELEEMLGKRTVIDSKGNRNLEPLMPAQAIRQMKGELIFLHGEHPPFKLKAVPFFDQPFLAMRASSEPYKCKPNGIPKILPLIPLPK